MMFQTLVPRTLLRRATPVRRSLPPLFTSDFDALLGGFWRDTDAAPSPAFHPRIDVASTPDEVVLTAELPGLESDDFEVAVEGDILTIKGEKKYPSSSEDQTAADGQPGPGAFARSFRIPFDFDVDAVSGSYRNGVLTVKLARPAEPERQVRTIPVTSD
jgi:HSP20 family protein